MLNPRWFPALFVDEKILLGNTMGFPTAPSPRQLSPPQKAIPPLWPAARASPESHDPIIQDSSCTTGWEHVKTLEIHGENNGQHMWKPYQLVIRISQASTGNWKLWFFWGYPMSGKLQIFSGKPAKPKKKSKQLQAKWTQLDLSKWFRFLPSIAENDLFNPWIGLTKGKSTGNPHHGNI